jgi:hypothetical protein
MMTTGARVLIDQSHLMFGGQGGTIRWINRQLRQEQYVVNLDNSKTCYEFKATELLIP